MESASKNTFDSAWISLGNILFRIFYLLGELFALCTGLVFSPQMELGPNKCNANANASTLLTASTSNELSNHSSIAKAAIVTDSIDLDTGDIPAQLSIVDVHHNIDSPSQEVEGDNSLSSNTFKTNAVVDSAVTDETTAKKKKRTRRGKKKKSTSIDSNSTVDDKEVKVKSDKEKQVKTQRVSKKTDNNNSDDSNDQTDDPFKHFKKRNGNNTHHKNEKEEKDIVGSWRNSKVYLTEPTNKTTPSSIIPGTSNSSTGKHAPNLLHEPPKKFSHSALKILPRESDELVQGSGIRPVRQPFGPTLNSNGFSREYQRDRSRKINNTSDNTLKEHA
jgi:hypothetical protein